MMSFFDIAKDSALKPVLSEVAKEALHHVQPGTAGRREMDMVAGMASQPSLCLGMFVCGVVVDV